MEEQLNPTALLLVQQGLLASDLAWQYQQEAQTHGCRLLPYLLSQGQICPKYVSQLLAAHFGFPWFDLDKLDKNTLPKLFLIPSLLRRHQALPLQYHHQQLLLAVDDPNYPLALQEIQFLTQCPLQLHIVSSTQLSMLIADVLRDMDQQGLTHYLHTRTPSPHALALLPESIQEPPEEGPIVIFVQRLLQQAIAKHASDLHLEMYADQYRIRYRHDGQLYELMRPAPTLASRITSCLKIMANLNITEQRLPQDGRFSFSTSDSHHSNQRLTRPISIDCRINTCPTIYGEKVAIRFLNSAHQQPHLSHLGLSERDQTCFLEAIKQPHGLILVTGPTGSGKTYTLYAALHYLNTGDKNISTIEDPVEIKLSGVNQVQINPKIGLGFAEVLRALLRQDPDIIMLGEIRDDETADMAMKAAQTGHVVLSTIHTQNCAQTLIRLKQLGIEPFLMSNITLILSQRLIRILCAHCKRRCDNHSNTVTYQAQGCHRCHQGYLGRKAIFEVMPISTTIQALIMQTKVSCAQIAEQAMSEGMLSLRQAGMNEVSQGATSVEEIYLHT